MSMPSDLIIIRHGESEGNVANASARSGNMTWFEHEEFSKRHSSTWRLTDRGIGQAQMAGQWLMGNVFTAEEQRQIMALDEYLQELHVQLSELRISQAAGSGLVAQCEIHIEEAKAQLSKILNAYFYVSAYSRAMETAGHLAIPGARWFVDPRLREREYGNEDLWTPQQRDALAARDAFRFYARPENGESIADCIIRIRDFLDTLSRHSGNKRVIIVCHGELMGCFRVVVERWTPRQYQEWVSSTDPRDHFYNGQALQYTRLNPFTGVEAANLDWMRSISTTDLSLCNQQWQPINRPVFSNTELLTEVELTPRLIS